MKKFIIFIKEANTVLCTLFGSGKIRTRNRIGWLSFAECLITIWWNELNMLNAHVDDNNNGTKEQGGGK